MQTDQSLRDRLLGQIAHLSNDKLRLLERLLIILEDEEYLDIVNESTSKYHTSNATHAVPSFNDNSEDHKTQEEWFQYFHEIEEGDFTSLEDANHNFELWKAELIKNRL